MSRNNTAAADLGILLALVREQNAYLVFTYRGERYHLVRRPKSSRWDTTNVRIQRKVQLWDDEFFVSPEEAEKIGLLAAWIRHLKGR